MAKRKVKRRRVDGIDPPDKGRLNDETTEDILDESLEQEENDNHPLAEVLGEKFEVYRKARVDIEAEWEQDFANYMQEYRPEGSNSEGVGWRARVFHPMTRVKVTVAMSQISDVWFQGGRFPFDLKNSPIPDSPNEGLKELGFDLGDRLDRMRMKIKDQLIESKAKDELLAAGLNNAIFGTAVIRCPFITERKRNRYTAELPKGMVLPDIPPEPNPADFAEFPPEQQEQAFGEAQQMHAAAIEEAQRITRENVIFKLEEFSEIVPMIENIDPWDFFADPESLGNTQRMNGMFCRSYLTPAELDTRGKMKDEDGKAFYDEDVVTQILQMNTKDYMDASAGRHRQQLQVHESEHSIAIFEYAGVVTKLDLKHHPELKVGDEIKDIDPVEILCTFCRGKVLRLKMNKFPGKMRPYHMVQWERLPGRPYGRGLARQLRDPQAVMNGFLRGYIDNKKLAGNLLFAISEDALEPGTDLSLRPGKNFRFRAGMDIREKFQTITIPDITGGLLEGMIRADEWGDLASGLPKVLEGEAIRGGATTAFEINQRVSSAAKQIGLVLRYFDERIIEPMILSLYHWNMAQDDDPEIKGDFEVVATGFGTFQNKSVRSQLLKGFLAMVQSMPALASRYKLDVLMDQIAVADDVDIDEFRKTKDEIKATERAAIEEQQAASEAAQAAQAAQQQLIDRELAIQESKVQSDAQLGEAEIQLKAQLSEAELQLQAQEGEAERENELTLKLMDIEMKEKMAAEKAISDKATEKKKVTGARSSK